MCLFVGYFSQDYDSSDWLTTPVAANRNGKSTNVSSVVKKISNSTATTGDSTTTSSGSSHKSNGTANSGGGGRGNGRIFFA